MSCPPLGALTSVFSSPKLWVAHTRVHTTSQTCLVVPPCRPTHACRRLIRCHCHFPCCLRGKSDPKYVSSVMFTQRHNRLGSNHLSPLRQVTQHHTHIHTHHWHGEYTVIIRLKLISMNMTHFSINQRSIYLFSSVQLQGSDVTLTNV